MNPEPSREELAKMQALQQKRTLAFVNHCVMTNVQCLNNFMQVCEDKLMQFERKLDRVDAAMVLLESKLLSIPEVNTLVAESQVKETPLEPISENPEEIPPITTSTEPSQDMHDSTSKNPSKCYPEYERFVKMVQVGVPLQAAKLKCALEGLDPSVLEEILAK